MRKLWVPCERLPQGLRNSLGTSDGGMRERLASFIASRWRRLSVGVQRRASRLPWRSGPRDLGRELREQSTEAYWRRRARAQSQRLRLVAARYSLRLQAASVRERLAILLVTVPAVAKGFAVGGALLAITLTAEQAIDRFIFPELVPEGDSDLSLGPFLTLAVPVSASFLGFYLATVSIVLGNSYSDVAPSVRGLVLGNSRTRVYIGSMGMAIGVGLALILLQVIGEPSIGYVTVGLYALLVALSGWAFGHLALRAFDLFNPIALREVPLAALSRAMSQLNSKGLLEDDAALAAAAQEAEEHIYTLIELTSLTSSRTSVDRKGLTRTVERLLLHIRNYAVRKHQLAPTSGWFLQEPAYPRWVESDFSAVATALATSTPLQPQMQPVTDRLEKRSAELASAALDACVRADDPDAALGITRAAALTTHTLARCFLLADALTLAKVVRDRCWSLSTDSAAARLVAAEPPLMLTTLLLGWRDAIASWPDEVRGAVATTQWDKPSTAIVHIRGPQRVWTFAQKLLREIHAEHDIQGRRVTPDWFLQSVLATECIISLREFAAQLPEILDDFIGPAFEQPAPTIRVAAATQALQAIAKAQLVADAIPQAVENLAALQRGHDPQPLDELEGLTEKVRARRIPILKSMADAVIHLEPEQASSAPDLFGEALFTLVHHVEEAIAEGSADLLQSVFDQVVSASLTSQGHMASTYRSPTYQFTPAIYDPTIDILELSGLALIYEVLRGEDSSADPVRTAWDNWASSPDRQSFAPRIIFDILDQVDGGLPVMSPRSIARSDWETRVAGRIVEAGYAVPEYHPFGSQESWTAPPLIKLLGVSAWLPSLAIPPRTIFAAQFIGPLSGESEEELRARPSLRRYFEILDFRREPTTGDDGDLHEEPTE